MDDIGVDLEYCLCTNNSDKYVIEHQLRMLGKSGFVCLIQSNIHPFELCNCFRCSSWNFQVPTELFLIDDDGMKLAIISVRLSLDCTQYASVHEIFN